MPSALITWSVGDSTLPRSGLRRVLPPFALGRGPERVSGQAFRWAVSHAFGGQNCMESRPIRRHVGWAGISVRDAGGVVLVPAGTLYDVLSMVEWVERVSTHRFETWSLDSPSCAPAIRRLVCLHTEDQLERIGADAEHLGGSQLRSIRKRANVLAARVEAIREVVRLHVPEHPRWVSPLLQEVDAMAQRIAVYQAQPPAPPEPDPEPVLDPKVRLRVVRRAKRGARSDAAKRAIQDHE